MVASVEGYVYDTAFEEERARLAGMEAQWDPGTFRHIEALGLPDDASCWEIGAGGGSVAAWLAERAGRLLVTDVDTRFVDHLASDKVAVERHDVVADPAPDGPFDLIHARLLLEHLPARAEVLDRLVAALRPGGWLLIEDYDWTSYGSEPTSETLERVSAAILEFMSEAGFDAYLGRRLRGEFERRGLVDAGAEGRMLVLRADHPGAAFYRLSIVSLREAVAERGAVTEADIDEALAAIDSGDLILVSPTMVAAWGRKSG
jgi:SAM-dependent methyltransferase